MPGPTSLLTAIVSSVIESVANQSSGGATGAPAQLVPHSGPAIGIVRTVPAGLQGMMSHVTLGVVVIDGKKLPLSPAAQIRNELNMIVMPSSFEGKAQVRYTVDGMGYVNRIWILTPAELAVSPAPTPPGPILYLNGP